MLSWEKALDGTSVLSFDYPANSINSCPQVSAVGVRCTLRLSGMSRVESGMLSSFFGKHCSYHIQGEVVHLTPSSRALLENAIVTQLIGNSLSVIQYGHEEASGKGACPHRQSGERRIVSKQSSSPL